LKKYTFDDLVRIMEKLRSPEGCPWDRKQTHRTLIPYLIEEVYEFVDAVNSSDFDNMKEELGDLLLQVVFHSQLAKEEGKFTVDDVVDSICRKLIFRHPHVFGGERVSSSGEVLERWEELKRKEGKVRSSILDGIPKAMPPLERAFKIQKRVAKVGFDWSSVEDVKEKVVEELEEIDEVRNDRERLEEEIGDLLFSVVNLSRFLNIDPHIALLRANGKFERRFRAMEEEARRSGRDISELTPEEMERLWEKAKTAEKGGQDAAF